MTENIQVITNEWIDLIHLDYNTNIALREKNKDEGIFTIEDIYLKIKWNNWGEESFTKINGIYYNCINDFFETHLETDEWNDIGVFDIRNGTITRKYYNSEFGNYYFEKNDLIIEWENWGKERFYQLSYGKYYKNTNFAMRNKQNENKHIKLLAIVFPQFHEIPENNQFWGDGFTEWTLLKNIPRIVNGEVIKQPHEDIGYFNLKDYNHRKYMRTLADKYNIFGFCYYHYWFKDKKVMYEPTELMLLDGEPNKPFLFCWANEQWTKRWDGGNNEVLLQQEYTDINGNIAHFNYLLQFFKHKNYIKKFNKPIFIFYRIEEKDVNDIKNIIYLWNNLAINAGFDGIHFMRFLGPFNNEIILEEISGFVQFAPGYFTQKYYEEIIDEDHNKIFDEDGYNEEIYLEKNPDIRNLVDNNILSSGYDHYVTLSEKEKKNRTSNFFVYDGEKLYDKVISNKKIFNEEHKGICVNWNNTPRRNYSSNEYSKYPHYYKNINPTNFSETLFKSLKNISENPNYHDDFLFISAWNEWNEQAILEPNNEDGYDYLEKLSYKYLEFYNFPKKGTILSISHKGGGTEKYTNDLKQIFIEYNFIDFESFDINTNYDELYKDEKIDLIHINSSLFNNLVDNYNYLFENYFKNIKKYITIHDYQWIYPESQNITQEEFINNTPSNYRIVNFLKLILISDKVIFPSQNIYNNYNIYFQLDNYKEKIFIVEHSDKLINYNFFVIPPIENIINIAFIGNFDYYKGAEIFKELADNHKNYKDYKVNYHIYGTNTNTEKSHFKNVITHGYYKDNEIIDILHNDHIHGIIHTSLFEETYCYALTNSINSGIPIFYLNRGIFPDRLEKNNKYNKYHSFELENINNKFYAFIEYLIVNSNKNDYYKLNENIQPKKWYLENYII